MVWHFPFFLRQEGFDFTQKLVLALYGNGFLKWADFDLARKFVIVFVALDGKGSSKQEDFNVDQSSSLRSTTMAS